MSVFLSARSCAFVLTLVFAGFGVPGTANATAVEPLDLPPFIAEIDVAEPFGRPASDYISGPLSDKWQGALRATEAEMQLVGRCRSDHAGCTSAAAASFIEIVDTASSHRGLARLGEINRAINLSVRPMSDFAQFGVVDFWNTPLATLAAAAGDCEDYAIAKYMALRETGLAPHDLRLVIWRDLRNGEDHAVAAVRFEGRWRILDNRRLIMVEDTPIRHVQPMFVLDQTGVRRYEEPATLMAGAAPVPPPATRNDAIARDGAAVTQAASGDTPGRKS